MSPNSSDERAYYLSAWSPHNTQRWVPHDDSSMFPPPGQEYMYDAHGQRRELSEDEMRERGFVLAPPGTVERCVLPSRGTGRVAEPSPSARFGNLLSRRMKQNSTAKPATDNPIAAPVTAAPVPETAIEAGPPASKGKEKAVAQDTSTAVVASPLPSDASADTIHASPYGASPSPPLGGSDQNSDYAPSISSHDSNPDSSDSVGCPFSEVKMNAGAGEEIEDDADQQMDDAAAEELHDDADQTVNREPDQDLASSVAGASNAQSSAEPQTDPYYTDGFPPGKDDEDFVHFADPGLASAAQGNVWPIQTSLRDKICTGEVDGREERGTRLTYKQVFDKYPAWKGRVTEITMRGQVRKQVQDPENRRRNPELNDTTRAALRRAVRLPACKDAKGNILWGKVKQAVKAYCGAGFGAAKYHTEWEAMRPKKPRK